jgi:hypothetical protein
MPMQVSEFDTPTMAIASLAVCFESTEEFDKKGEPANVVDGLYAIARAVDGVRGELADLRAFIAATLVSCD